MATLRGSYQNRLQENKMFCDKIEVGTGVTEYFYTDRHAWEVIEVKDQKHVTIRRLAHKKKEGATWASNQWELMSDENEAVIDLTKRGNYWYSVCTLTKDEYDAADDNQKLRYIVGGFDPEKIAEKGKQTKLYKMNVSFGVADYYYDYEF